jgi:signal transduction histidine kinase
LYSVVMDVVQNPIIQKTASDENVEIRLEGVPALVKGDRQLLFQAINNVIQNALDAQPYGGEINIKLAHSQSGEARIVIMDRGPGISLKDFDSTKDIFLPFSSTKTGSKRLFFGLSLAYTQKIIEAHGGKILARNVPSKGAEIEIVMGPSSIAKSFV